MARQAIHVLRLVADSVRDEVTFSLEYDALPPFFWAAGLDTAEFLARQSAASNCADLAGACVCRHDCAVRTAPACSTRMRARRSTERGSAANKLASGKAIGMVQVQLKCCHTVRLMGSKNTCVSASCMTPKLPVLMLPR